MSFEQIECGGVPLDGLPMVQLIEAGYLDAQGRPAADLFYGSDAPLGDLGDLDLLDDCPAFECVHHDTCELVGRCAFGAEADDA